MRSVFFPPGWVLALILTTFGAQANGICQWLTIQWSPDDSTGDFSLYHVVVPHSWATKCTQPGRWKSSIHPWSFPFWDDDRVWVKENSPPWCGKNNTTSLAEWPPWVIGEIIPNWLGVCARLTFAQKWKLSNIKGNSTSGHRILWVCGACSIQTTSISHELDKHQESPGIFNNHPLHSIFFISHVLLKKQQAIICSSPVRIRPGPSSVHDLGQKCRSGPAEGAKVRSLRGHSASALARTSEDFWGLLGTSGVNFRRWPRSSGEWRELWVFTLPVKWQIVASQGATESCPITWWHSGSCPRFILGDFAGGYRTAKQISMESADSGLDSWIVPSSHHPMTLPRMNKVNPDTATARPEAVKDWMVMVKKTPGSRWTNQATIIWCLLFQYSMSTYISPVHLIILGDLNICLCCSNL